MVVAFLRNMARCRPWTGGGFERVGEMKKTVVALGAAALLASVVHVRDASANMATDIGAKVAEKVASAVLGEVGGKIMGKIFGTGPDPLTLA
jgi:hypothetical protein